MLRVVKFIEEHSSVRPEVIDESEFEEETVDDENSLGLRDPDERDVLFFEAARLVVRHNQGSVSFLQRRLKIG